MQRQLWPFLLLATLLAPAATADGPGPVPDQIWYLRIVNATIGPPSASSPQMPPPVPCLPCSIDQPGHAPTLAIDVGDSGPIDDPDVVLTGIFFGVGGITYTFDLSKEPDLLADYEAGVIAFLVIENPPPDLEGQRLTLRYTLRWKGIPRWTEREIRRRVLP